MAWDRAGRAINPAALRQCRVLKPAWEVLHARGASEQSDAVGLQLWRWSRAMEIFKLEEAGIIDDKEMAPFLGRGAQSEL